MALAQTIDRRGMYLTYPQPESAFGCKSRHIALSEADEAETCGQEHVIRIPDYPRRVKWEVLKAIGDRLASLSSLPEGWDTYKAKRIDQGRAMLIISLVMQSFDENTPIPFVVPTSEGGIQLEWHLKNYDLEIETLSGSRLGILYSSQDGGDYEELEYSSNLDKILSYVEKLSEV